MSRPRDSSTRAPATTLAIIAGAFVFIVLATMNSSGYRYGAGDQAFYIPAIRQHLDPSLFPHDFALLYGQARFTLYDELIATIVRTTGVSLPVIFFAGYVLSLVLLYAALILFGQQLYASAWTSGALAAVYTLRHRIAKTGANTLEGYFHPRILVFALGVFALRAVLQRRAGLAWGLIAIGAVLHPTTALFFAVWIGVALAVNEPRQRMPLLVATLAAAAVGVALVVHGTLSLKPMDREWIAALTDKDYIFPTRWTIDTWVLNLLYPVLILAGFWMRRRLGVLRPGETGLVVGCLALVAIFLASWPLLIVDSTFAVQLQLSRMFWMADLLAFVYAVWMLAEMFAGQPARAAPRVMITLALVLAFASARGWFALRHDHPGRPLIEIELPDDEWADVGRWLREHTPASAGVLADPGHAWRFGTSVRVSADRDVFIEDVKDISIGMYDRAVALRNTERRAAIGDFVSLTPAQLQALAARYDLQYLVTDQPQPLDEVYHNARFHVYRLK